MSGASFASPDASGKYVEDGFSALGYARRRQVGDQGDPPLAAPSRDWLAWIDVRGADFNRNTFGSDLKGTQVNAIAGLTRKFTPNFLVGVLGGYEHFDYSSQAFNGVLKGDGWTTGTYLGWRLTPNLRFDAAAPGRIFWSTMPPARPPAISSAIAGWPPAA